MYKFHNKFEKEKFPVMEMFLVNNSTYEATGRYEIFKGTVKISNEDFIKVKNYAVMNNGKNIHCNCISEDDFIEKVIEDIILKYDKSNIEYVNTSVGGNIVIQYRNDYCKYSDSDECIDMWFTKADDNNDFPRGFISFYEIAISDFNKAENIHIKLEKFMKDN